MLRQLAKAASRSPILIRLFYFLPEKVRLSLRRGALANQSVSLREEAPFTKNQRTLREAVKRLEKLPIKPKVSYASDLDWTLNPLVPSLGSCNLGELGDSLHSFNTVSFDFWDTLVGRTRPAESVKRLTALRASLQDWNLRGFKGDRVMALDLHLKRNDEELRQSKSLGESIASLAITKMIQNLSQGISTKDLLDKEVEDEVKFTAPLISPEEILNLSPARKVVVSDHYLSEDSLRIISRAHDLESPFKEFFVSSQTGKTKRNSGELFVEAGLSDLSSWAHIGDSPSADFKNSSQRGASAVLANRIPATSWNVHDVVVNELADQLARHLGANGASEYLVQLSAISFGLTTFAIEQALKLGKNEVVYLSREGETLALAQNSLKGLFDQFGIPWLPAKHLEISRISCFFPSFDDDLEKGFVQLGHQYPTITGRGIAKTLGLPNSVADSLHLEVGVEERVRTTQVWSRLSFDLKKKIQSYCSSQKLNINDLLKEKFVSPENSLLGDLGWRGTIHDSLSRIAGREFSSVYLGLFRSLDGSVASRNKVGFLFDEPRGLNAPDELTFFGPLERAFTISDAQVLRYEKRGSEITSVFSTKKDSPSPSRVLAMQIGFEATVQETARALLSIGLFGTESKDFVGRVIDNWITQPSPFQASAWFDETHAEGFGAGDSVHYEITHPSGSWLGDKGPAIALQALRGSLWHEGYLAWVPVASILSLPEREEVKP